MCIWQPGLNNTDAFQPFKSVIIHMLTDKLFDDSLRRWFIYISGKLIHDLKDYLGDIHKSELNGKLNFYTLQWILNSIPLRYVELEKMLIFY